MNRLNLFRRLAVLLGLILLPGLAAAETFIAYGMAELDGRPIGVVRQAALQDALREAAMRRDVHVQSATTVVNGVVSVDTARVVAGGHARRVEILEEWTDDRYLHLRARVQVDASGECNGPQYRRRIAALSFPLAHPEQIYLDTVRGFERGLPRELLRRLTARGDFLPVDATSQALPSRDDLTTRPWPVNYQLDPVISLGEQLGTQFIVAGEIRDAGLDPPRSLGQTLLTPWRGDSRRIEVEVSVYDAASGARLHQSRHSRTARGEVMPANTVPFASADFFRTDYGQAVDAVLNEAVAAVDTALRCRPLVTRVLRVAGDEVHLDSGEESRLAPGQVITVYSPHTEALYDSTTTGLGQEHRPAGMLTVTQVYPRYAVAHRDGGDQAVYLRRGDYVVAW